MARDYGHTTVSIIYDVSGTEAKLERVWVFTPTTDAEQLAKAMT